MPQAENTYSTRSKAILLLAELKVVFSKSGLAVSVPKNANILETILVMKISKLELYRERLRLSCHMKI